MAAFLLRWADGLVQFFHPLIILDILKPTLSKSLFHRILHIYDTSLLEPVQVLALSYTQTTLVKDLSAYLSNKTNSLSASLSFSSSVISGRSGPLS